MAMYHGQGNSGPAREVWHLGDRVKLCGSHPYVGTVAPAERDRNAFQTGHVWVKWDDGEAGWCDPNLLDDVG